MHPVKILAACALALSVAAAGCSANPGTIHEVTIRDASPGVDPTSENTSDALDGMQKKIDDLERRLAVKEVEDFADIEPSGAVTEKEPETQPEIAEETPTTPPSAAPAGPSGITVKPGVLGPMHVFDKTPPKVDLVIAEDNRTFVVMFSEAVDFQALVDNHSVALYEPGFGFANPVQGTLVKDELGQQDKMVKFIADEPARLDRDGNGSALPTVYTLKIFGADSADPSRAAKDKSGNALQHESAWKLTCAETPEYLALTQMQCE